MVGAKYQQSSWLWPRYNSNLSIAFASRLNETITYWASASGKVRVPTSNSVHICLCYLFDISHQPWLNYNILWYTMNPTANMWCREKCQISDDISCVSIKDICNLIDDIYLMTMINNTCWSPWAYHKQIDILLNKRFAIAPCKFVQLQ